MSDQFLAEIRVFPFNYAPLGWAMCNGQLLSISQNTALFSLLGTSYGGDGRSNFALPNLQGCVAVAQGTGPGLSRYEIGQDGGTSSVTLQAATNGIHTHPLNADQEIATAGSPSGAIYMQGHYSAAQSGAVAAYTIAAPDSTLSPAALLPAGSGQPHNNMMPYLTLNFCIALSGIFPPRS
jgi:microcystin-dependent protein